jgi:glutathione S-transferase
MNTTTKLPELTLHFAPDTCARVALTALEEIGCPYNLEVVAFMKGQHRSAGYLALNPGGKVPTLVIDGEPLTENVAILTWLADRFPEAKLLPAPSGLDRFKHLSDLAFCASGLHPLVTRLRIPHFFCDLPEARQRVFDMAATAMKLSFAIIEERLGRSTWWYGDQWSIVDAYINWVWFRVTGAGFEASAYTRFARHNEQMQKRPAVIRMLARNAEVASGLAAQGLAVSFSGPGAITAASR